MEEADNFIAGRDKHWEYVYSGLQRLLDDLDLVGRRTVFLHSVPLPSSQNIRVIRVRTRIINVSNPDKVLKNYCRASVLTPDLKVTCRGARVSGWT